MLVIDGASGDGTLKIVESFASDAITRFSEPDKGVYDAMTRAFHLFQGDAIDFLNSDDTFHDANVAGRHRNAALRMPTSSMVTSNMVTDHRTKRLARAWRGGDVPPLLVSARLGYRIDSYMRRKWPSGWRLRLSYLTTAD